MAVVPAVLFDVDGTLVDSNYLHVYAWSRAFAGAGIAVESWRIHRSIGMDGSRLTQSLAGDADDGAQQRAEELHTRYLKEAAPLLRAGVDADHAVYVGDAVWDVIACGRACVPASGLLSGGVPREELEKAGAENVFDNPGDLCEHIGSTTISTLGKRSID